MDVDLNPFGFTPTESLAFNALLRLGATSGYAVAKTLSIARANAYQALDGLVAKHAAERSAERPHRYRAVRPDALLARLTDAWARRLDRLEFQLAGVLSREEPVTIEIAGNRALVDVALRIGAREAAPMTCLAPPSTLEALKPLWRKRLADGRPTTLWSWGDSARALPLPPNGVVSPGVTKPFFAYPPFILAGEVAVVAVLPPDEEARGYWTSDPVLVGLASASLAALTRT